MIKHIVRTSTYLFLLIMLSVMALDEASLADGTITVQKVTVPAGFGNFNFQITQGAVLFDQFTLDHGDPAFSSSLPAGAYTITETLVTAGFNLTNIICVCPVPADCDDVDLANDLVNVMLNEGETIACVFTNTGNGTIIIEKETIPVGGIDFGFTTNIPGNATFTLDDGEMITRMSIPAGTYMVTEDDPAPGFVLSEISCDDMGSMVDVPTRTATIDLDPNETITCTFRNTISLAGLNIFKTDMPDPVIAGNKLTYEIKIENGSNFQATMVMFSDLLPMGVMPFSVSTNRQDSCEFLMNTLEAVCNIGNLASGEVVTVTIIVIPDPGVFDEAPTPIVNTATLTAEPGSIVREVMAQTLVNPIVDIHVENTKNNSTSVEQGQDFQLNYNVTNNANEEVLATLNLESLTLEQRANALGVTFNLSFSALFEVISVETTVGIACIVAPGSIVCPLGTINEGQTETVTINFRAPQEKDTYDFDAVVTSLLQIFENKFRVRVESDNNNCSIAPVGASPSVPLYLFIPLFILIRRFRRRTTEKTVTK